MLFSSSLSFVFNIQVYGQFFVKCVSLFRFFFFLHVNDQHLCWRDYLCSIASPLLICQRSADYIHELVLFH